MIERALQITSRDFRLREGCTRVSGIGDPFNGHIDEFRIAHVQGSDGWIATTWNNISDPCAFAVEGPSCDYYWRRRVEMRRKVYGSRA